MYIYNDISNCVSSGKCTVPQSIECNDGTRVYPTKSAFADIGDVVQYSVPSRYGLIGDPPVCQPDSTWSAPPNCLSKYKLLLLLGMHAYWMFLKNKPLANLKEILGLSNHKYLTIVFVLKDCLLYILNDV